MKKFVVVSILTIMVALVGVGPAMAGDTQCVGALTGTHDNVVVPPGAHCEMTNATVIGNVKVLSGGSLRASNSRIGGSVQGDNSDWVCLQFGTQVRGNFEVKGGQLGTTTGHDISTIVNGNTKVEENAGLTFIDAATVGGNIEILKNTGTLEVEFNTIGGNIKVEDNVVPAVYTGGPPQPAPGGCGLPSAFLIPINMSVVNNVLPRSNVQIFKNSGPGTKTVAGNRAQTVQCFDNTPPFVGGPNFTTQAQGQCFAAPAP
jgi:hypothetical protein